MTKQLLDKLEVRPGTRKAKCLEIIAGGDASGVPVSTLLKGVYGSKAKKEAKGKLALVLRGLRTAISDQDLPYDIVRMRSPGEAEARYTAIKASRAKGERRAAH